MSETKWFVGAMNDGLFIIDQKPSPSGTDIPPNTDSGANVIAKVVGNDLSIAHKLAAAPELYEALEPLVPFMEAYRIGEGSTDRHYEFMGPFIDKARRALAKARGEA